MAVVGGLSGEAATRQSSQCWLHNTNGFTSTCTHVQEIGLLKLMWLHTCVGTNYTPIVRSSYIICLYKLYINICRCSIDLDAMDFCVTVCVLHPANVRGWSKWHLFVEVITLWSLSDQVVISGSSWIAGVCVNRSTYRC